MATAQLLNAAESVVDDSLQGLVASQPSLNLLDGHRVVVRSDIADVLSRRQVTLVSGGGSGHEPSHAGLVGKGMLSAAVAGDVFASPPASSVLAAILAVAVAGGGGVLVIIKNYTGDRLHFGLAVERARGRGHDVRMVVMADDMAFDSDENTAGRRGLAGALFLHKVCGAMADQGKSLDEVYATAQNIVHGAATIGVSLSPCCVPGRGPSFKLPAGVMELGLGIHGEAGLQRTEVVSADRTVAMMADRLFAGNKFQEGFGVALIVNNLGGLSNLELGVITKAAISHLEETRKLRVERVCCGALMTSINMAGVSLSLLRLDDAIIDSGLAYNVQVAGWPATAFQKRQRLAPFPSAIREAAPSEAPAEEPTENGKLVCQCLRAISQSLMAAEQELNELDREAGDGDCGSTLKQAGAAILSLVESGSLPVNHLSQTLVAIASKLENVMGGTSGALYTLMLVRVAHTLDRHACDQTPLAAVESVSQAIDAISKYGGAKREDRTMLDALYSMEDTLKAADLQSALSTVDGRRDLWQSAVKACQTGAEATRAMQAHAGRASYVSAEHWTKPDAGATAVAMWTKALCDALWH